MHGSLKGLTLLKQMLPYWSYWSQDGSIMIKLLYPKEISCLWNEYGRIRLNSNNMYVPLERWNICSLPWIKYWDVYEKIDLVVISFQLLYFVISIHVLSRHYITEALPSHTFSSHFTGIPVYLLGSFN